jgi:hypothetical protein
MRRVFLEQLAAGVTVSDSAKAAGGSRHVFRHLRLADEEFAQAWEDAWETGADTLEEEAFRRAVEGVENVVTVAGKREIVREFSDVLLIMLLKSRRPERFARFKVSGAFGGPVDVRRPSRLEPEPDRLAALAEVANVLTRAGALELP